MRRSGLTGLVRPLGTLGLMVAATVVGAACGPDGRAVATTPAPPAPDGPELPATVAAPEPVRTAVRRSPPRGVPHGAAVVATAVSRDATAALSRDALGEVRLWPTLDGAVAAQAVPVRGVTGMRVQATADVVLSGLVTAGGGGHLLRHGRHGRRLGATALGGPGQEMVLHVAPLADASGALVLFADHTLALVDRDGATVDTLARRGMRVRALEVVRGGAAIALVRRSTGDGGADHAALRLDASGGRLRVTGEVALPLEPLEPTLLAVAGDGARLAYAHAPAPPAAPAAAGAPARKRPRPRPGPPPPSAPAKIAVLELAGGKDVTPAELRALAITDLAGLGFSASDRLHVVTRVAQWEVDLAGGVVVAGNLPRIVAPAVGDDLLVTGFDVSLLLQAPGGAVRYLGWQANVPQRVALSRDGRRAAWGTARGELIIEDLDGSEELSAGLYEAPLSFLAFLDDEHLVVGSGPGTLHLVDARSGRELGAMAPPGPLGRVEVDARTGWIAGLRPGGGVWMVRLVPGQPMPSTTHVVADGAQHFQLLAGEGETAPRLLTVDGALALRRYGEAEIVAGLSAKQVRERPTETLPRVVARFDRRGRGYSLDGRKLQVLDGATVRHTFELGFDVHDVAVSDDGAQVALIGHQIAVAALDGDGAVRWTASLGLGGRWAWTYSGDGTRLAAVGSGGGVVLDTATGEQVAAGCAWRFGASSGPPLSRATGVVPLCR